MLYREFMRLPGQDSNRWYWADATPAAQAVVWAGVAGDHLPYEAGVEAMGAGFGLAPEDVDVQVGRLGLSGIVKFVVGRVAEGFDAEQQRVLTAELSELAGHNSADGLAGRANQLLADGDVVTATEVFKDLSGHAASRLAKAGFYRWRLAQPKRPRRA